MRPVDVRNIVTVRNGVSITRLGPCLGAEISGVDLRGPLDDAQRAEIDAGVAFDLARQVGVVGQPSFEQRLPVT